MKYRIIEIYEGKDACEKCEGWKQVADTEEQESWKHWMELPPLSRMAVAMGLVKPIECPVCHGQGKLRKLPPPSDEGGDSYAYGGWPK
jgi:hypothetical protein